MESTWPRAESKSEPASRVTSFDLGTFAAILFDLDSTLIDTKRYPLKGSEWLLAKCVPEPSKILEPYVRELLRNYYGSMDRIVSGAPYMDPFDLVRGAMKATLKSLGISVKPSLIDEATRIFRQLHLDLSEAYPGVLSLLQRLKDRGTRMAVVSNSFDGHTKLIMEKLGLSQFFEVLVDSGDARAYKPMKEPFDYALGGLGVESTSALYVGDEYLADMVGAWRAGMKSVWVNSRGHSLEESLAKYGPETAPLLVVNSITELSSYLL